MFSPFSLAEPRHLKPWRVDASTLQFLTAIPEVQVRPLPDEFYEVVIPAGVMAMWTTSDEGNGSDTWLYRFPSGQVLGHDTEGMKTPESVWPATESIWDSSTPFGFALACYHANIAAGRIPSDTPPPDPADYAE
jgi:hypothetical protein